MKKKKRLRKRMKRLEKLWANLELSPTNLDNSYQVYYEGMKLIQDVNELLKES